MSTRTHRFYLVAIAALALAVAFLLGHATAPSGADARPGTQKLLTPTEFRVLRDIERNTFNTCVQVQTLNIQTGSRFVRCL